MKTDSQMQKSEGRRAKGAGRRAQKNRIELIRVDCQCVGEAVQQLVRRIGNTDARITALAKTVHAFFGHKYLVRTIVDFEAMAQSSVLLPAEKILELAAKSMASEPDYYTLGYHVIDLKRTLRIPELFPCKYLPGMPPPLETE